MTEAPLDTLTRLLDRLEWQARSGRQGLIYFILFLFVSLGTFAALDFAIVRSTALAQQPSHTQQALQLYRDVVSGRRAFQSLTPEEQQMVRAVIRASQRQSPRGASPECRDAIERAQTAAEEVASQGRKLTSCVEGSDYRDDCSTSFRRLRSTYSEYESAVSDVGSYCD